MCRPKTKTKGQAQREYELRNPGRTKVRNAKFRTTVHGISCYLYWNAHRRAKVNGLIFSLTKNWIKAIVAQGVCQVTGLSFSLENGRKPWAPSLDRIDPTKGYTADNVQVVVWLYNTAKMEFRHEDVMILANALTNGRS